jgi:hypothetical protein
MAFSLRSYLTNLEGQLDTLSSAKRLVFSLWCVQPLLDEFGNALSKVIGTHDLEILRTAIDAIWDSIVLKPGPPKHAITEGAQLAQSIDWPDEEESPLEEEFLDYGAMQLVQCLQCIFNVWETGSSESAAEAANQLIDRIDYELNMIDDISDTESDPRFQREINNQQLMLVHLQTTDELSSADRNRYRG